MSGPRRDPFVPTADEADMSCKARFERSDREIRDERYRIALIALLEEVLVTEELEALAYDHAQRLEAAADLCLASRAIVNHCDRELREKRIRAADLRQPQEARLVFANRCRVLEEVRARWGARNPIPTVNAKDNP